MASPDMTTGTDVLHTVDGTPLKTALALASRRARIRAFFLVLPLLIFILLTFAVPIGQMLSRSFTDDKFSSNMVELGKWFDANGKATPDEAAYAALAADLATASRAGSHCGTGLRRTRSSAI